MNIKRSTLSHQLWRDVYAVYWSMPASVVRRWVPSSLGLDTFEGEAWVSLVAFSVRRAHLAILPEARTYAFDALDLRTHVEVDGRPGLYLHSTLGPASRAADMARRALGLPCPRRDLKVRVLGDRVEARARDRTTKRGLYFSRARITTCPIAPRAESLQRFLTERRALFWSRGPVVVEAAMTQASSELHACDVLSIQDHVLAAAGLPPAEGKPSLATYAAAVDVDVETPRIGLSGFGPARPLAGRRPRATAA